MLKKPHGKTGLARLWCAFFYSCAGFTAAWKYEAAFRQEAVLALILLPLGIWLGQNGVERALLCGSVLVLLAVELLNSAVEAVVDLASPDLHDLAKRAKDMGSAAVLIALTLGALTWVLVLWR